MTKRDKSDDSGDSDFDPHHPTKKGKKHPAKKKQKTSAIITKVRPAPASLRPTQQQHYHAHYISHPDQTGLSSPIVTPIESSLTGYSFYDARKDSVIPTQYSVQHPVQAQTLLQPPFNPQYAFQQPVSVGAPLRSPFVTQPQTPVSPQGTFTRCGMLDIEDEVLEAQLNYSRRGKEGHCSRDTADLWVYMLRLFFPASEGYDIVIHNYQEQNVNDQQEDLPGGVPVIIQLWSTVKQFHPLYRQFLDLSRTPILSIICGSVEAGFEEFPGARIRVSNSHDVLASTPLQKELCENLDMTIDRHNMSVQSGGNQAQLLKSLDGAVACGTMVRFYKLNERNKGSGWMRAWTSRGSDLVNGVPSGAMWMVERILTRIKEPGKKVGKW